MRAAPIDIGLTDQAMLAAAGRSSFGARVEEPPESHEAALGVVWRLIARGRIGVDPAVTITPATIVGARSARPTSV